MDQLDRSILAFLQQDGRKPFTEIAKSLSVTEGTVRKRVARLTEDGVVKIIGIVDPLRIGFDAPAIIRVKVQPAHLEAASATIATYSEVSYLLLVTGDYDLIVEVMCRNREHLSDFIRNCLQKITGVTDTHTTMILHVYKVAEHYNQPELPVSNSR